MRKLVETIYDVVLMTDGEFEYFKCFSRHL